MTLILSIALIVWIIADLTVPMQPWRTVVGVGCVLLILLGLLGVIHIGGRG